MNPGLIKESKKIEIVGDLGKFLPGQRGFGDPRLFHARDHGGSVVPDLGCQIQLRVAKIDPAQVRPGLSSLAFDGMAFHASFAHKQLAPSGRVFRKYLGNGRRRGQEKDNDDSV